MSQTLIQNRYEIIEELIPCRYSVLYTAKDRATGKNLVVRALNTPIPMGDNDRTATSARAQILKEGRFLGMLKHRNLPRVLDIVEENQCVYLLLEEIRGKTLETFMKEAGDFIPETVLLRLLKQFISVLDYLHSRKPPIIHRDLRPDSVLMTFHGIIKLAEFGLAKMSFGDAIQPTMFKAVGSPHYAAPEQLLQMPSDPRNDIYSVGAIFYYLATRETPPKSTERGKNPALSIREINPDISIELERMIMKMMEPDMENRYASASELMRLYCKEFPDAIASTHSLPRIALSLSPDVKRPSGEDALKAAAAVTSAAGVKTTSTVSADRTPQEHLMESVKLAMKSAQHKVDTALPDRQPPLKEAEKAAQETPVQEAPAGPEAPPAEAPQIDATLQSLLSLKESMATGAEVKAVPELRHPEARPISAAPKKGGFFNELFQIASWFGKKTPEAEPTPSIKPSEEEMAQFPYIDLRTIQIDKEIAKILTESISKSIEGICIGKLTASEITVAVKDPTQVFIYDHISYSTRDKYKPTLVRSDGAMLDLAREYVYKTLPTESSWLEWMELKKYESDKLDVKHKGDEMAMFAGMEELKGPVIEAVDRIIKEAISIGASDIHMENFENEMVVRYRIDGVLQQLESFHRQEAQAVTKRIKIIAGMDIAMDRVTQGGRISVKVADRDFDLRVSIVPVTHGENIVMRLLNKGAFTYTLSDLGFQPEEEAKYRSLLDNPHGMILVSGPTGSGKSTTLYASLKEINRPDRKLLTVEDPIEYEMAGITQVQVNMAPKELEKKVTFARALREFLRQDPDVILVGEIRDSETAGIAVQAALTGHLLLSTIHTNNAVGIITRLEDMGVESFLVSSTLVGGLAQRLVRKICPACRQEVEIAPSVKKIFDKEGITDPHLFRGAGCVKCRRTGHSGRVAIYEMLQISPKLRTAISSGANIDDIQKIATDQGMRSLYQDGLRKAAAGLITFEEVQRVAMEV